MIRRDRNHASVAMWEATLNESDNSRSGGGTLPIVHEEFPGPCGYAAGDPIKQQSRGSTVGCWLCGISGKKIHCGRPG